AGECACSCAMGCRDDSSSVEAGIMGTKDSDAADGSGDPAASEDSPRPVLLPVEQVTILFHGRELVAVRLADRPILAGLAAAQYRCRGLREPVAPVPARVLATPPFGVSLPRTG